LGSWLGKNGYPVWGIIQRQGNRGADIFFQELRESYGMKHLYRKSSLDNMYKLLKENNMLILASDQDAKKRGVFVKFFGQSSSTPKGSAIFHMRSGAPMVFSVAHREKDGTIVVSFSKIELNGSTSIETITQTYTNLLEEKVREFPDHYFWFHRKWKTKAKA
jgi:KDO2-lipid IV(A) lauroyltransferase